MNEKISNFSIYMDIGKSNFFNQNKVVFKQIFYRNELNERSKYFSALIGSMASSSCLFKEN